MISRSEFIERFFALTPRQRLVCAVVIVVSFLSLFVAVVKSVASVLLRKATY
jgi:hypothetical protein